MKRSGFQSSLTYAWRLTVGGLLSFSLAAGCDTASDLPAAQTSQPGIEVSDDIEVSINPELAAQSPEELRAQACVQARVVCKDTGNDSPTCDQLDQVCTSELSITCAPTDCEEGEDCPCPQLEAMAFCVGDFVSCLEESEENEQLECVGQMVVCMAFAVLQPGSKEDCPEGDCPDSKDKECPDCPDGSCPDCPSSEGPKCPDGDCPGCPDCPGSDGPKCPDGDCPGCPDCPGSEGPKCPGCPDGGN